MESGTNIQGTTFVLASQVSVDKGVPTTEVRQCARRVHRETKAIQGPFKFILFCTFVRYVSILIFPSAFLLQVKYRSYTLYEIL